MSLKCGIVGLPNVGKSTLFNALTKAGIAAENYPFCTIEPNVGVVELPDPRLQQLADIITPERIVPAIVEFVDIAGLVAGASPRVKAWATSSSRHIRETDAIVNVVRCFEDDNVIHVAGKIDPISDIEVIQTELCLADLGTVEKSAAPLQLKAARSGQRQRSRCPGEGAGEMPGRARPGPARALGINFSKEELVILKPLCLITAKPAMFVGNVDEAGFENNPFLDRLKRVRRQTKRPGGGHLRQDRGRAVGDGRRRPCHVPGRNGPGRTGPEPPDPRRLQAAGPANLLHRRREGSARLDHPHRRHRARKRRA